MNIQFGATQTRKTTFTWQEINERAGVFKVASGMYEFYRFVSNGNKMVLLLEEKTFNVARLSRWGDKEFVEVHETISITT